MIKKITYVLLFILLCNSLYGVYLDKWMEYDNSLRQEYKNIILEGKAGKIYADKVLKIINLMPENLVKAMDEEGFKVILTSYDIAKYYYKNDTLGSLSGLFSIDDKKIYIHSSFYYISLAVAHEIGHFLDYYSGWTSDTDEFIHLYELEKDSLKTIHPDKHYKSSSTEFFAQAFKEYIHNPSRLKITAPNTYEYITKILKGI